MDKSLFNHYQENEHKYDLCIFMLGLVNNMGFQVIIAFSQQLADTFNKNYFFSVFLIFLSAMSGIARFINAVVMIKIQHVTRILMNTSLMLFSFMMLALAFQQLDKLDGFYFCILACLLHGFSQAFGEATLMGYFKALPTDLIQTFGSGTGLSGFTDILTILFLQALGVSNGKAFLILAIFLIPYYICFLWIDDKRKTYFRNYDIYISNELKKNNDIVNEKALKQAKLKKLESKAIHDYDDSNDNKKLSTRGILIIFQKAGQYIVNIGMVNFFEYLIINLLLVIYVDRKQKLIQNSELTFFQQNMYSFLMFAYYTGSFISRSTIQFRILSYASTNTIFQLINLSLFFYNIYYNVIDNFYVIFFFLIWVGFQGGTAYTNFFFLANANTDLSCDFKLHYTERELCVNLLFFSNDLGILFAGIIGFLIQAYFFPSTLTNPPG